MSTNSSLVAQIGHLQKQLSFYKGIVNQHQDFFVEVYNTLDSQASGHLAGLQKKCRTLSNRAQAKSHGGGAKDDQVTEDLQQQQYGGGGGGGGMPDILEVQTSTVSAVAEEASSRIQAATVKLLNLWSDHVKANVQSLLNQPDQAFDVFHETPTNESLEEFLSTYRHSATAIRELLKIGEEGDKAVQQLKGPQGNPFEMDDRLLSLYKVTITESFDARCNVTSSSGGGPQGQMPSRAIPISGAPPGGSSVQQQQQQQPQRTTSRRPMPRAQSKPGWNSDPTDVDANNNNPEELPQQPRGNVAGAGQHQQRTAANRPPSLNTAALHQTPHDTNAHPQSQQRVSTPRHSKMSNDSGQMRSMLGGEGGENGAPRPSTPHVPFEKLPRLMQLKITLQQLEVQLGAVAVGKDTGSEAKYYALTKKLQRVRAEVLKEQREAEAVGKSQRELAAQKNDRDDRRRHFNR